MNNKEFDDIIKKKLESLNTNGSEDAWDLFKVKWNNESDPNSLSDDISTQDEELDEKIKNDLKELRIPFNSKHWIILKEQLELEALFKKKLFVAKSVELIILAFLMVGVLNLWPIQSDIYQIPVYDSPMVASIPVNKETAEKFDRNEQARIAEQKALFNKSKTIATRLVSKESFLSKKKSTSAAPLIKDQFSKKENIEELNSIITVKKIEIEMPFIYLNNKLSERENHLQSTLENDLNYPIAQTLHSEISPLDIPIRPTGFPDIVLNKGTKKEENTYLSFAIGPKVNLINSPFDPVYEFDPYNTINTNFNISAKINKEIGPIELYAGLGYTNTSYVPRLVDEYYEPRASQIYVASLENIKFKTFNVPVGVKYNLVESNKFQFYASAGVDLNIIADSEYIIQDKPAGNRSEPGLPPSPGNFVNENAKLSQKEFNKGILSGGNLKDNLFATASVGLGLNWNISNQSGLFMEPRYSHFISSKGIGPNEDKVHGLSIELGVRYQLN
jgi:hypothetical protein